MNTKVKKKTLSTILNELPVLYLESLLVLVDLPMSGSKKQLIDNLLLNLKNPIKIKNYFHNLNNFQKMVISDVIYNLDGNYIESYMLAKYDKAPLFERKSILFTNKQSPNYLSLFIYQKSFIPLDLQRILKTFTPKPSIWEPESYNEKVVVSDTIYNTYHFVYYTYLYSQINIIKTNKKKFKLLDDSQNLLGKIIDTKGIPLVLKLLFYSKLIIVKNRKVLASNQNTSTLTDLLKNLINVLTNDKDFLYSIYKKNNLEYIKNIIKFRNIVISSIFQIKADLPFQLKEIYKFIEINNYNKSINITKAEKMKDLKIFIQNLSYLGVINFCTENNNEIISMNQKQIDFLSKENSEIEVSLNKEVLISENFEVIITENINTKNKLFLMSFTSQKNNKKYLIDKTKLLKLINKGLVKLRTLIRKNNNKIFKG